MVEPVDLDQAATIQSEPTLKPSVDSANREEEIPLDTDQNIDD